MNAVANNTSTSVDWGGPAAADRKRPFSWRGLVWLLVFPRRRHRIALTVPGLFLMALAMGIGTAAYNTASNILFITLSLLLACLLLSGLLSWFNFMGLTWRLRPTGAWRVGHDTLVTVEIANAKRWLPTYSLWFDFVTKPVRIPEPPEGGKGMKFKELLAAAEKYITRGRVYLRDRVEAKGTATVAWGVKPTRRGEAVVELASVGSLFPFGFLQKSLGSDQQCTVLVWPAQVEYQWVGAAGAPAGTQGQRTARAGMGDDLLALRKYAQGDSHRLIHWKASARLGQLMIRQFAAESHDGYVLDLDARAELWTRPEQFELFCGFAGTLAEDLFAQGRLRGARIDGGTWIETRRVRDVEAFLDALARLSPAPSSAARETPSSPAPAWKISQHNIVSFGPEGARGVAAYVDGRKTASA